MFDEAGREILARIRGASRRASHAQVRAELAELPEVPAAPLPAADLPGAFLANVVRLGGSCAVASSRRDTVDAIGEFVAERHGQRRLVAGHDPRLAALPWRDAGLLPRFGSAENDEPVAVSYARSAVAETGSVLLWRDRDNPASNSLLAEDHIVLVDEPTLVERLEQAFPTDDYADPQARPRGAMLISGPSSTADINLHLVMGAHGPRCWHVILVGAGLDPGLPERARQLAARQSGV